MEHAAAAGQSEMAGVGGQQVVWPEDVLDQRTHLGHEQQIAEALPLVEQETDVLFLVRSDAAMLELFLRGDLLVQSVAQGGRGVPADNAFHDAVALLVELPKGRRKNKCRFWAAFQDRGRIV